jgi:hypothetical protein
MTEIDDS